MKRFEALWYDHNGNYFTKEFYTKEAALRFYEAHKNDHDKKDWWVTKRNSNWEVIEDIII